MTAINLFWTCAALIVIAQVMILRSTRRAHRHVTPADAGVQGERSGRGGAMEWLFAVGPAVAIAFLLYFTWRAATQPPVMNVRFDATGPVSAVTAP